MEVYKTLEKKEQKLELTQTAGLAGQDSHVQKSFNYKDSWKFLKTLEICITPGLDWQ